MVGKKGKLKRCPLRKWLNKLYTNVKEHQRSTMKWTISEATVKNFMI